MKHLSPSIVRDATVLLRQGNSVRKVARMLGISMGPVVCIRREEKNNIPDPKRGRPSKVSRATVGYLARQFASGKILSIRDAQRSVRLAEGVPVHEKSIRRYLEKGDLKRYVSLRKRGLTCEVRGLRISEREL